MKKGLMIFAVLFSLSFVSAYYGSYYGGGFSLSDLLNEIDSETMLLGVTFIVSFALINLSLQRVFKDNKAVPGVVAFCIALTIAWGINRSGYNLDDFFYGIGFSEGFLFTILPLAFLGFFIYSVIKWRGTGVMAVGIIIFAFGSIGFFEEQETAVIIGAVIAVIGFGINKWFPKRENRRWSDRFDRRR